MNKPLSSPIVWQCGEDWCVGQLHLTADTSPSQPETGILIISGGTQTRVGAHRGLWQMACDLVAPHRAILRFDPRGRGDSTGQPGSFEELDDDILCAVQELRRACPGIKHLVLLGHCDGASAALLAVGSGLAVDQLILINPWARTEQTAAAAAIQHNYGVKMRDLATWKRVITGQVNIKSAIASIFNGLKVRFTSNSGNATDFVGRMSTAWIEAKCKISVVHGTTDATAQEFEFVCKSWQREAPLAFYPVAGGDHSFSTPEQHHAALAQIELALGGGSG
jgi:uncharacterized protein